MCVLTNETPCVTSDCLMHTHTYIQSSATLDDLSAGLAQLEKEKNELNSTIHQLQNPDETQTFSATVNNVDIYNDCETSAIAACAVSQVQADVDTQSPCLTDETDIEVPVSGIINDCSVFLQI